MKREILSELSSQDEIKIQAHINNISFPKSIDELEYYILEHRCYNVEDVLQYNANDDFFWTVPRSCKIGDIVLFFHAKTAIQWIRKLETKVKSLSDSDNRYNKKELVEWLKKARDLYMNYGGKIFAVGRVASSTYFENEDDKVELHYGSRIYADIDHIVVLENPIDISEFNSFLKISRQSGITMIPFNEFEELKRIILIKNKNLPSYYRKCKIGDFALTKINRTNFLSLTYDYRRRFILEAEFRSYYVDYILKQLFGEEVFRECVCHTNQSKIVYFVDNAFVNNDKVLMLEVKLNINNEKNLIGQLEQYTNSCIIDLTKDYHMNEYERNYMYVIDTMYIYRYYHSTKTIVNLVDLDNIRTIDDVDTLKHILI